MFALIIGDFDGLLKSISLALNQGLCGLKPVSVTGTGCVTQNKSIHFPFASCAYIPTTKCR